jgi:hypothetical protein
MTVAVMKWILKLLPFATQTVQVTFYVLLVKYLAIYRNLYITSFGPIFNLGTLSRARLHLRKVTRSNK